MNINVGGSDRVVRVVMGTTFLFISLTYFRPIVWLLGMAMLYTGLYRNCPLYRLVGFSTAAIESRMFDSRRERFGRTLFMALLILIIPLGV
jgi:hypothetical protein